MFVSKRKHEILKKELKVYQFLTQRLSNRVYHGGRWRVVDGDIAGDAAGYVIFAITIKGRTAPARLEKLMNGEWRFFFENEVESSQRFEDTKKLVAFLLEHEHFDLYRE